MIAVDNVTLDIERGEFFALLGPSGCGKTTLLRMLAGFEMPTEGQILIDGQDMGPTPPNKRPVNMVFQSYAVFPHMTVADNVGYGLQDRRRAGGRDRASACEEALDLVQLGRLWTSASPTSCPAASASAWRSPARSSRSRKVLLLDEPLSALDAKLREAMRFELSQLQQKVGITFIMVTHDQDEALAHRHPLRGHEQGRDRASSARRPTSTSFRPTRFVADFIGSVNMFEGSLTKETEEEAVVACPELAPHPVHLPHAVPGQVDTPVWVAIRPEKMSLHKDAPAPPAPPECPLGCNVAKGTIREISYLGDCSIFHVQMANGRLLRISRPNRSRYDQEHFAWNEPVWVSWAGSSPVVLLS